MTVRKKQKKKKKENRFFPVQQNAMSKFQMWFLLDIEKPERQGHEYTHTQTVNGYNVYKNEAILVRLLINFN